MLIRLKEISMKQTSLNIGRLSKVKAVHQRKVRRNKAVFLLREDSNSMKWKGKLREKDLS